MEFNFKTKPYKHQLDIFERFKDKDYFALFADMGTGKTKVTLDIAAYRWSKGMIDSLIIIAPNNVHMQWCVEQAPMHCAVPFKNFIWQAGRINSCVMKRVWEAFCFQKMPNLLKIFAINVETFQSDSIVPYLVDFLQMNPKPFIVIDEATRIKHNTAKRTKTIHKLEKYGQRAILTGTPTAKSPFDLWSQMEFLKKNYFQCNYFIFQHRYGILVRGSNPNTGAKFNSLVDEKNYALITHSIRKMKEERNGPLMPDDYEAIAAMRGTSEKNVRFIEANPAFTRYKRLDELRTYIQGDVFAIKKEDCLDLPEKIYEVLYVDMTAEQKRVYKNLKTELFAQYDGHEVNVTNKVALTTRLMQVVGGFFPVQEDYEIIKGSEHIPMTRTKGELIGATNAKLEAIKDDLEELGEGTKIIIWAHFVSELQYIYNALKKDYKCALYYGATLQDERKAIIKDFQAGNYDIFIGNAATAGFGLNLQNATVQYYYSNTFRTEERLQAEDRSHRIGVKSNVLYKDIIVKGTVDELIYKNIAAGRELNDFFKEVSVIDLLTEPKEDIEDGSEQSTF